LGEKVLVLVTQYAVVFFMQLTYHFVALCTM